MHSDYDELSRYLCQARRATVFILTHEHRTAYTSKLAREPSEQTLRDYYNVFNETTEPDAGEPMLDGIRVIRQSLDQTDESSVVVLIIG